MLNIFTNDDIWSDTEDNRRYGHLGTCDRENPSIQYDKPGKTFPLLSVAHELITITHRDGHTPRITLTTSHRVPNQDLLLKGHTQTYLEQLKAASITARDRVDRGENALAPFGKEADVSPGTYTAALRSVGAALDTVDNVFANPHTTAFALVWPPGHHAEPSQAMGFCYLATAALAAIYGRDRSMDGTTKRKNRVALIDIDHHRGNGSAAVLASQPDILFIDQMYRSPYDETAKRYTDGTYDHASKRYLGAGKEYPYTRDDTYIGAQAHPVIHAPNILQLEHEGFQSADALITEFVDNALPRLIEFQPDLIIWSVGLDSAVDDPLGGLGMTPEAFYTVIKGVRLALPTVRHCGILEGGYDPVVSAPCLRTTLLGFSDDLQESSVASFERYARRFVKGS